MKHSGGVRPRDRCVGRAVLVFDPEHRALQTCLDDQQHWIDEEWGPWFHLATIGNPEESGPEFRKFLKGCSFSTSPKGAWDESVAEHATARRAVQYETATFVRSDPDGQPRELPYLLIRADVKDAPTLRVSIPRVLAVTSNGPAVVVNALRETFTRTFLLACAAEADDRQLVRKMEEAASNLRKILADPGRKSGNRGGRRPTGDPKVDARTYDAWASRTYKTFEEFAHALGRTEGDVRKAVDRERKRRAKSRRKGID